MPPPANPTLREDILAAALRLIEEKGAVGLTMREVAGALGYSATAIYQHFGGKEELLLALKLRAGDLLTEEMEIGRQEPTLDARLPAMGRRYIQFGLNNPAYYRLIFQDTLPGVEPTAEQLNRLRRSYEIMRETLAAWVQTGGLQGVDVNHEANVLWAMVHGITSLALAGRLPFTTHSEIFALFDLSTARWASGILSLQPAPPQKDTQKQARHTKRSALTNQRSTKTPSGGTRHEPTISRQSVSTR